MSKAARIQINKGQIYYSEEELEVISEIKENYKKYLDFEDEEIRYELEKCKRLS